MPVAIPFIAAAAGAAASAVIGGGVLGAVAAARPCPVHRDVEQRGRPGRQARQIPGHLRRELPPP